MDILKSKNKLYIITFLAIIMYYYFFLFSNKELLSLDWYAINSWLSVWKAAFKEYKIPYYANMFVENNIWGSNFFALPYIILSPQILLLKIISIKSFILLHILISALIGFYGIINFQKKFNLTTPTFLTLVLFFYLGGFWTDRISVGHIQNSFYLSIPTFLWFLYNFTMYKNTIRKDIIFSLFLFIGLLQGSFHVVYQFIFILCAFSIFNIKKLVHTAFIIFIFSLLAIYFIIPNFLFSTYTNQLRYIDAGYGVASGDSIPFITNNIFIIKLHLQYFVKIVSHFVFSFFKTYSPTSDAVWEFSIFSSPIILYYIYKAFFNVNVIKKINISYLLTICILILLSIGSFMNTFINLFQVIFGHKFPIIDRLPSRMFIYPFSIIFIYSIVLYNFKINYLQVILSSIYLLYNSYIWRVDNTLSIIRTDTIMVQTKILTNKDLTFNSNYITAVNISYLFTFFYLLFLCFYLYKTKSTKLNA